MPFFATAHSHLPHELNQVVDVQYVRYIVHRHFLGGEQRGADYLQHLVFCSLRVNVSAKPDVLLRLQMKPLIFLVLSIKCFSIFFYCFDDCWYSSSSDGSSDSVRSAISRTILVGHLEFPVRQFV